MPDPRFSFLRGAWSRWKERSAAKEPAAPKKPSTKQHVAKRIAKWCALVVVIGCAGYLVLGNAFLFFRGVPWLINRETTGVHIDYSSAWTWWPGRVKLRDFRLAFRNDDIEFDIELDHAVADISLTELFHKRFVAHHVTGDGLVYRMRLTRPWEDLQNEETNAALPRIAGFADLPMRQTTVPRPPPSDASYDLWSVYIPEIDVGLREVWVEQVRVVGRGHIHGGFELVPMRFGSIHDVVATLEDGRVDRGPVTIGENFNQRLLARVLWFDCQKNGAESLERNLDAVVVGDAMIHGADILNAVPFFTERGLHFEDAVGPVHARIAIQQGKLNPGSLIRADMANVEAWTRGVDMKGTSGAVLKLIGRKEGMDLDITSPVVDVIPAALEPAKLHAENAGAVLHFHADPALVDAGFDQIALDVPASNTNLAALDHRLGPVRVSEGAGFARLSATLLNNGSASGELNLAIFGLDAHGGRARARGEARAKITFATPSIGDLHFSLGKSELDVDKVDVIVGDSHPALWRGHTELDKGSFEITKQGPLFDLPLRGSFKDASPILAIFKGEELVPGFAANLLTMKGLEVTADLKKNERNIDLDIREAKGEGGRVEGIFLAGDEVLRGAFRLHAGILSLGVSFREGEGPKLQLIPSAAWLEDERKVLRSTVAPRRAPVRPASAKR